MKAQQLERKKRPSIKRAKRRLFKCRWCGGAFYARRAHAKTCSAYCRVALSRHRRGRA